MEREQPLSSPETERDVERDQAAQIAMAETESAPTQFTPFDQGAAPETGISVEPESAPAAESEEVVVARKPTSARGLPPFVASKLGPTEADDEESQRMQREAA